MLPFTIPQAALPLSLIEGFQQGHHIVDPDGRFELLIHRNAQGVLLGDLEKLDLGQVFSTINFEDLGFTNTTLYLQIPTKPGKMPELNENESIKFDQWIGYNSFHLSVNPPDGSHIHEIDEKCFNSEAIMDFFWPDFSTFKDNGIGYYYRQGDKIASLCFSAFRSQKFVDIQVLTHPEFMRQGLSFHLCNYFLHEIFQRGLTPKWHTQTDNLPSQGLAGKLGFSQPQEIPFLVYTRFPQSILFDPAQDDENLGRYIFAHDDECVILKESENYYVTWNNGPKRPLFKEEEGLYFVKKVDAKFKITKEGLILQQFNQSIPALKSE